MRNHFSQLLSVHSVNDVRLTYTQQSLVPELIAFWFETAIGKLRRHKSTATDQIPAEIIRAGDRKIHSEIRKLINSIWNKDEMPKQWMYITSVNYIQNFIQHFIKVTAI